MKHILTASLSFLFAFSASADTYYVWTNSPSDGPGTNWVTAFHRIQDAVDVAVSNDVVLVTNGVYEGSSRVVSGTPNRVVITNRVEVRSVNGPAVTVIRGVGPVGAGGIRGVYLGEGSTLSGFTVTNGATIIGGNLDANCGGGVLIYNGGTVSNCVISGNAADSGGGGVFCYLNGLLVDSTASGNTADSGAGVYLSNGGTIDNCIVRDNVAEDASYGGGGVMCWAGGTVLNSTIVSNESWLKGGGIYCYYVVKPVILRNCTIQANESFNGGGIYFREGGLADDCTISGNAATNSGGGVYFYRGGTVEGGTISSNVAFNGSGGGVECYQGGTVLDALIVSNQTADGDSGFGGGVHCVQSGTVQNCLLLYNAAGSGGGIYCGLGGTVQNCTISSNSANSGAGIKCQDGGLIQNTIMYFNIGSEYTNQGTGGIYSNNCTVPAVGTDCVTNDPRFLDPVGGDYRLQGSSLCIDAGADLRAQGVLSNLEGVPRPLDGNYDGTNTFDIGAYEAIHMFADSDADTMPDTWEWANGLDPTNAADATEDADGDYFINIFEYVADTDPADSSSYFYISDISNLTARAVYFLSSFSRNYTLEYSTNLVGGSWTNVPESTYIPGNGEIMWLTDTNEGSRFYRIKVWIP